MQLYRLLDFILEIFIVRKYVCFRHDTQELLYSIIWYKPIVVYYIVHHLKWTSELNVEFSFKIKYICLSMYFVEIDFCNMELRWNLKYQIKSNVSLIKITCLINVFNVDGKSDMLNPILCFCSSNFNDLLLLRFWYLFINLIANKCSFSSNWYIVCAE